MPTTEDMQAIVNQLQTRIVGGKNINVRSFGDRVIVERKIRRKHTKRLDLLNMVFASSVRTEDGADLLPVYNDVHGDWDSDLADLEDEIENNESARCILIAVKRENAHNHESGNPYTTGADKCYPDAWEIPGWLHVIEWTVQGDCGETMTTSLTEELLREWYQAGVRKWGKPRAFALECAYDSGIVIDDVRSRELSSFAMYGDVNMTAGDPVHQGPFEDFYYTWLDEDEDAANFAQLENFYDWVDDKGITVHPRIGTAPSLRVDTAGGGGLNVDPPDNTPWPSVLTNLINTYGTS